MLRVVQWATGAVGRSAAAAVHSHPDLELVGSLVYSQDKAGRDLGEICGIGSLGVKATADREEILALDADCVIHTSQGEIDPAAALDEICSLLVSGKNVVSTAVRAFIYPLAAGQRVVDRLESACMEGGTSFHSTGIEPGWAAEVLPLTMSGLFKRKLSIIVQELLDYTSYACADMLIDTMGFGQPPDAPVPMSDRTLLGPTFRAPLMLVAEGLGATIEKFTHHREVAVMSESFDVAAGRIDAGTVSAQRFSFTAIVDGREALTIEHITRLGQDQAPDWPTRQGWRVAIEGVPSMVLEATIAAHGEDHNDQGVLGTAMHAVHSVVPVCAASPGIRTFLDLPMIVGRRTLRGAG